MLKLPFRIVLVSLISTLLSTSTGIAQEKAEAKKAYLNEKDAGADFAIQGEYTGKIRTSDGELKIGIQVIAHGGGKLAYAAYFGGLPGDGWAGSADQIVRGTGEIKDGVGTISGEHARGEIKDGAMTIYSNNNERLGEITRVVRQSPTIGMKPPEGATVLFDGTTADKFDGGRLSDDKLLMEGVTSKDKFGDFRMHLEFRLAFMPNARGQARSNSGCYLQGRYELQILDSFGLSGEDNECGGIYKNSRPSVNMCYPPLSWQTYDIDFTAAKFDKEGKKVSDAVTTIKHNGIVIHDKLKLAPTPGGPLNSESSEPGPLFLQDHSDPLRFRNIWVKSL